MTRIENNLSEELLVAIRLAGLWPMHTVYEGLWQCGICKGLPVAYGSYKGERIWFRCEEHLGDA